MSLCSAYPLPLLPPYPFIPHAPLAELSYSRTWYVADMAAIPERCQVTGNRLRGLRGTRCCIWERCLPGTSSSFIFVFASSGFWPYRRLICAKLRFIVKCFGRGKKFYWLSKSIEMSNPLEVVRSVSRIPSPFSSALSTDFWIYICSFSQPV